MKKHMKAGRCVGTVALSLTLALAAPVAAFGADDPTTSTEGKMESPGATTTHEIKGTVKATTLKVTVPTKVAFYIDPGATQGTTGSSNKYGQFTNPTNYTITNRSAVDIYGYVSGVTAEGVTLTKKKTELSKPGGKAPGAANAGDIKVMMGLIGDDDATTLNLDAENGGYTAVNAGWLTAAIGDAANTRYFAFNKANHGKLAAGSNGAEDTTVRTDCKGHYTMTVRGAVHNGGWAQDESFTVKPVFKVTTTDPTTT